MQLQRAFWNMHRDAQGKRILRSARMARFVPVKDCDYDPIRKMTAEAATVEFLLSMDPIDPNSKKAPQKPK